MLVLYGELIENVSSFHVQGAVFCFNKSLLKVVE